MLPRMGIHIAMRLMGPARAVYLRSRAWLSCLSLSSGLWRAPGLLYAMLVPRGINNYRLFKYIARTAAYK